MEDRGEDGKIWLACLGELNRAAAGAGGGVRVKKKNMGRREKD
jgi:hypothetical protein